MKDFIYIFQFKSSLEYKLLYIYSLFRKIIGKILTWKFKSSYINTNKNYIIENKNWIYKIFEPSDMHAILKPHNEEELEKYFQLDWWIFLDIWWNVWKYSIMIWKQNIENKVYTFEPNPNIYKNYLLENIKLNKLNNINVFNQWLASEKWELNLNIPIWNDFWSASLIKNKQLNTKEIKVKLNTLDNFITEQKINISDIKLFKIDVEWFELNVLEWWLNFLNYLEKTRIIIEITNDYESINNLLIDSWFRQVFNSWINYVYEK